MKITAIAKQIFKKTMTEEQYATCKELYYKARLKIIKTCKKNYSSRTMERWKKERVE